MVHRRFIYKRMPHHFRALATGMVAGLGALLLLGSCQQGTRMGIELPATPQLFGSLPWGLVNVNYTKGFIHPRLDSAVAIVLRGGDMVKIVDRSQQQERIGSVVDYWYQVEADGVRFWIFGNLLSLYGLEMQAQTASEIVHDKLFKTE